MATDAPGTALETFAREAGSFAPPAAFAARANVRDRAIYDRAARDLEGFWSEQARALTWRKPFTTVLEWEAPYAKWFLGGELNVSENCLDRHVKAGRGSKVAYHWEGEPGDSRTITYQEVLAKELQVMDSTATSLCMDNRIPIVVFDMGTTGNIMRVVCGEEIGTRVE